MQLPGSVEAHRLRPPAAPARVRILAAALALALALAGCSGIERAGVSLVEGGGTVSRRLLRAGVPTEDAELSLVRAALELVSASGRHRPSADGGAHFSSPGARYYGLKLVRRGVGGRVGLEGWRLDGAWAVRELPGGVALCWRGDMRVVVETLGLVLPSRPPSTGGPSSTAAR